MKNILRGELIKWYFMFTSGDFKWREKIPLLELECDVFFFRCWRQIGSFGREYCENSSLHKILLQHFNYTSRLQVWKLKIDARSVSKRFNSHTLNWTVCGYHVICCSHGIKRNFEKRSVTPEQIKNAFRFKFIIKQFLCIYILSGIF